MAAFKDITGKRFGRLVALEHAGFVERRSRFRFQCDCGTIKVIRSGSVLSGVTLSCGCLGRENRLAATLARDHSGAENGRYRHGQAKAYEYRIWTSAKQRCRNPNNRRYKDYGARGITFCERWDDFANFIEDMGHRPEGTSLDRIDNDGPYSPENCRWASKTEQALNTRRNVPLSHGGETKPLGAWARDIGMSYATLRARILNGWDHSDALNTPVRPRKGK